METHYIRALHKIAVYLDVEFEMLPAIDEDVVKSLYQLMRAEQYDLASITMEGLGVRIYSVGFSFKLRGFIDKYDWISRFKKHQIDVIATAELLASSSILCSAFESIMLKYSKDKLSFECEASFFEFVRNLRAIKNAYQDKCKYIKIDNQNIIYL